MVVGRVADALLDLALEVLQVVLGRVDRSHRFIPSVAARAPLNCPAYGGGKPRRDPGHIGGARPRPKREVRDYGK
ncbi:hypothetical protein GCM10009662_78840 [Catellatospora coxensis]|uniref:Uncharacterized protein n=1 Tax=Catellatospora coxensis TaxID=310354 RepID=A0A8J3L1T1_9ACTN|nr:hypothetical protein Cco03nite_63890 [Catellatospora coxensis]